MADLVVDTVALRATAGDLRSVVEGAVQARSRVGSWRVRSDAVGDGRAQAAVEDFADRWSYGLSILADEAASLASMLSLAAATFEAIEARLTAAAGASSSAPFGGSAREPNRASGLQTSDALAPWPMPPGSPGSFGEPWWVQLARADHPRQLVSGEPGEVEELAAQARRLVLDAAQGANEVRSLTVGQWIGAAADAVVTEVGDVPGRLDTAAESFGSVAAALLDYAGELTEAQGVARRAMVEWAQAEEVGRAGSVAAGSSFNGAAWPADLASGPGAEHGEAARRLLGASHDLAKRSAAELASVLRRAADAAPHKPGFWSKVGHFLGDTAKDLGRDMTNLGAATVNALASLGVAMIDHPEDTLAVAAGVALMAVSAGGEATGIALSATGVGAIAGVPVAAVSAAGVAAGASVAVAAMGDLGQHAMTDDSVTPASRSDGTNSPASSAKAARDLDRQLASEAQMQEPGTTIAGEGTKNELRVADRLARDHGGVPSDWVKQTSSEYVGRDGKGFQIHWYENLRTGERVELKTKFSHKLRYP
jgi:hypothetical protein